MDIVAIQSAQELDPSAKAWVQKLVGRELQGDERVGVRVVTLRPVPPAPVRQAAAAQLNQLLDKMSANLGEISQDEFDAALDEAMKAARPTYERMP